MYRCMILFLLTLTYCHRIQEKEDENYKKKLLELLYDVDAPKVNASYVPDSKQNIILFVTNMPKEIQNLEELKSKFPVHGYVEGNGELHAKGFGGLYATVMGLPHDTHGYPLLSEGDCETLLENSIASLLGWASNVRGMTTGLVHIEEGATETSIHTPGAENFEHLYEDVQFVPSADELAKQEIQDEKLSMENVDDQKGSEEDIEEHQHYDQLPDIVYEENGYEQFPKYWKEGDFSPLQDYRAHAIARRRAGNKFMADDVSLKRKHIFLPSNKYKRETFYTSSPARQKLIKPSNINTNRYNKYNVFDFVRQSFLDKLLNTVGLPASVTDEMSEMDDFDANSLGKVRPPSYYQLVKDALKSVRAQSDHAADTGYLLAIKGGRPEDTRDFIETLKYVLRYAPEDKTLIVVTGSCPRYGSDAAFIANRGSKHYKGPEKIPYYATGPRSLKLNNFKRLYELPKAIKEALSKPIDMGYDYYDKVTRSAAKNPYGNATSKQNSLRTQKIDAYRNRILNQQKEKKNKIAPLLHGSEPVVQLTPDKEAVNIDYTKTVPTSHHEPNSVASISARNVVSVKAYILLIIHIGVRL